jgi:molybdopterin/thiamine biosynthesis adenylyltransferase
MREHAKVRIAHDHLRRRNPWSDVAVMEADVATLTPAALLGIDAALLAFDNDAARADANRLLTAARVPAVDAGVRADLWLARATVIDPRSGGACGLCGWSRERLARAGEDVGVPCAQVESGDGWPSSLPMGHAAAALAVHALLALAGVLGEAPGSGTELRLDLRRTRLERFDVARDPACAVAHGFALSEPTRLDLDPLATSLRAMLVAAGATPDDVVLLARGAFVAAAACAGCGRGAVPLTPAGALLPACGSCGGAMHALRQVRRAPASALLAAGGDRPSSAWLAPGDVFALERDGAARAFLLPGAGGPWQRGRPLQADEAAVRFRALPECIDLERVRATRLALLGLGHLGAAALSQLAPLPWAGLLLVDRDAVEEPNLAAWALAAEVAP